MERRQLGSSSLIRTVIFHTTLLAVILLIMSSSSTTIGMESYELSNNCTLNSNASTTTNGTICTDSTTTRTAMDWFWVIVKSIYFNAIMSGLFAGVVTICVTVVIERLGPQIGGVLATVPSAIVPALIGFALDANRNYENDEAMRKHVLIQQFFSVPISVFCNITMMVVWKYGPHLLNLIIAKIQNRKVAAQTNLVGSSHMVEPTEAEAVSVKSVVDHQYEEHPDDSNSVELKDVDLTQTTDHENLVSGEKETTPTSSSFKHAELLKKIGKMSIVCFLSLVAWFIVAAIFVVVTKIVKLSDEVLIGVSMGFFGLVIIFSVIFNWKQPTTKPGPPKKVAWWLLMSRGILAFVIICISVLMGGLKLTFISGMFSVFPVISLSSLISLWLSQGEVPTSNAASTMMVGSNSLPVFASIMCICLWSMHVAFAFLIGFSCSVVVAVMTYGFLWWRKKVATNTTATTTNDGSANKDSVLTTTTAVEENKS